MKSAVVLMMMVMSMVSNAKAESSGGIILIPTRSGLDSSSVFDFRSMLRTDEKAAGNGQIRVSIDDDKENVFRTRVYAGSYGQVYDLGEKSCKDLHSTYYEDQRQTRGTLWLAYSDADPSALKPSIEAKVYSGHCYLLYQNLFEERTVVLFDVLSNDNGSAVIIGNIEVLDKR